VTFGSRRVVTGLDVGTTSVKAVCLGHGPDGARLLGLSIVELDRDADAGPANGPDVNRKAAAIREALARSGADRARGAPIITAVGGPGVSIKHVAFPPMSRHALAESIHWEARKHVPFGESDFILDFQILNEGNGNGKMEVLLAACEAELVEHHVADLGAAGVEPDAVDLVPLALMNEADEEGLLNSETLAVIDIGVTAINLAIHRRGGLFFSRTLPLLVGRHPDLKKNDAKGGGWTRSGAPDAPGIPQVAADDDDAWRPVALAEIHRSLTFYNNETGKKGIDKIYLTGGRALAQGVIEDLTGGLGIATEVMDPFKRVEISALGVEELAGHGPRFAVAMGLARRT
jgi:type IV pilus assembly protein PilM